MLINAERFTHLCPHFRFSGILHCQTVRILPSTRQSPFFIPI